MTFVFVSGNLALDFAGTLKWRREAPEELLITPDDVARWAVEGGIVTETPTVNADELARLRDLREAVYRLVTATLDGESRDAADARQLNLHADGRPPRVTLGATAVSYTGTAESIGWATARAAVDLLAHAGHPRLRECQRPSCTRIFVDQSRTGNRRWCGMEECGNRVKAANYRARKTGRDRSPAHT